MASLLVSRRDIEFLLYEWLDVCARARRSGLSDHTRETLDAALDIYEAVAEAEFAPQNKLSDQRPPRLEDGAVTANPEQRAALQAFADAGLLAACLPERWGGMSLPYCVERAGMAFVIAAGASTAGYAFLTMANANLLLAYGSEAQRRRYITPMLTGKWMGTMCLSEPQAGSSLADIMTRAEPQSDGRYRLRGNKMWISAGDHDLAENIVHLVLAKVPDATGTLPAGTAGISLFVVPKYTVDVEGRRGARNDVTVAGLNHKMGYRGTSNCLLNFGEGRHLPEGSAGALGEIVGEEGRGLALMFHMMNEARIGVGMVAAALGSTGYLHALEYARNRRQGRLPGARDMRAPAVRLIEHADVRRMLLAQKALVEGALALVLYCAGLVDDLRSVDATTRTRSGRLLELLTPVAKSWPSKWGVIANDLAIQIHGGYGYTQDFNVEQFYRDNRLNPIHEGTVGIQAIDLLGRKVRSGDGEALADLGVEVRATLREAAAHPALAELGKMLECAWERLVVATRVLQDIVDPVERLANACCYLDAFGHVVVGWLWLQTASVIQRQSLRDADPYYRGKLAACRYYFRWEMPRVDRWLALLQPVERTPLEMRDEDF
ncbi:MAG: acyl-CoA dehydrogenase [Proteobacteria bacterium]|nr:acyl-CoA dehydrogenase [Pseudomonadota bacterium]